MKFGIWLDPIILSSSTFNSQVIVFLCENVKRDDRNQIVARKEKRENGGFWLVKESESEIPIRLYPADPMTRISRAKIIPLLCLILFILFSWFTFSWFINGNLCYTMSKLKYIQSGSSSDCIKMGENSEIVLIEGERLFPFQL